MKTLIMAAAATLLAAAPLYVGPAAAANGLSCSTVAATAEGMRIEFHNRSSAEIPAGATVHWRLRGVAQGDATFIQALVPGGTATHDYLFQNAEPALGAACSVEVAG